MKIFLIAAWLVSSFAARAGITVGPALRLESDLTAWNRDFAGRSAASATECRETREIAGAFLCVSRKQDVMHETWFRASVWAEGQGDVPAGTLISRGQARRLMREGGLNLGIGGYDLRSEDLAAFQRAAEARCGKDADYCLSAAERGWQLMPQWARGAPFVMIAYALESSFDYQDVVTHEVMHAQYFLQPRYRAVVDAYWDALPPPAKQAVASQLQRNGYGVGLAPGQEQLLKNEFQAFMLMANADQSTLSVFVKLYRTALLQALVEQGIVPVQVY